MEIIMDETIMHIGEKGIAITRPSGTIFLPPEMMDNLMNAYFKYKNPHWEIDFYKFYTNLIINGFTNTNECIRWIEENLLK